MHKKEKHNERKTGTAAETTGTAAPPPSSEPAAPRATSPGDGAGSAEVESPALSAQEIESLKAEAAQAKDHWERYLRATADFENYKKRVTREREEASRYAGVPLLQRLIPVLDNFEMAQAAAGNAQNASVQSLQAGIAMIYQQLRNALLDSGLQEIEAAGKPFDHNLHEAVSQQPSLDVPEGQVLQQLRKGYKLHERLLRPATVIVACKSAPPPAEPPSGSAPAANSAP